METTEFGIVTEVNLEHPWNAEFPMEVTELGMITEFMLQPEKVPSLMEVIPLPIDKEDILQPEKADEPVSSTESGMTNGDVRA